MKKFLLTFLMLIASVPMWAQSWTKELEKSAKNGDVNSQLIIANAYFKGDGITANKEKAAQWYYKATINNNAEAKQKLYSFYSKELEKFAKGGDAQAQYEVGMDYYSGEGIAKNTETAAKWFQLASTQGHEEAKKMLYSFYSKELEKAAKGGDAQAQYALGIAYRNGDGVEVDLDKAGKWFLKSWTNNYEPAKDAFFSTDSKDRRKMHTRFTISKNRINNNEIVFDGYKIKGCPFVIYYGKNLQDSITGTFISYEEELRNGQPTGKAALKANFNTSFYISQSQDFSPSNDYNYDFSWLTDNNENANKANESLKEQLKLKNKRRYDIQGEGVIAIIDSYYPECTINFEECTITSYMESDFLNREFGDKSLNNSKTTLKFIRINISSISSNKPKITYNPDSKDLALNALIADIKKQLLPNVINSYREDYKQYLNQLEAYLEEDNNYSIFHSDFIQAKELEILNSGIFIHGNSDYLYNKYDYILEKYMREIRSGDIDIIRAKIEEDIPNIVEEHFKLPKDWMYDENIDMDKMASFCAIFGIDKQKLNNMLTNMRNMLTQYCSNELNPVEIQQTNKFSDAHQLYFNLLPEDFRQYSKLYAYENFDEFTSDYSLIYELSNGGIYMFNPQQNKITYKDSCNFVKFEEYRLGRRKIHVQKKFPDGSYFEFIGDTDNGYKILTTEGYYISESDNYNLKSLGLSFYPALWLKLMPNDKEAYAWYNPTTESVDDISNRMVDLFKLECLDKYRKGGLIDTYPLQKMYNEREKYDLYKNGASLRVILFDKKFIPENVFEDAYSKAYKKLTNLLEKEGENIYKRLYSTYGKVYVDAFNSNRLIKGMPLAMFKELGTVSHIATWSNNYSCYYICNALGGILYKAWFTNGKLTDWLDLR